jgi:calcium-dependent protein kinase
LQGVYSSQADLWSLGVITFMLLSSSKPFYDKKRRVMVDQIMRGKYAFAAPVWDQVSEAGKDFVSHLLVVDPRYRYTSENALNHTWIVDRQSLSDERPSEIVLRNIDSSLIDYTQASHLKKLALNIIAHQSSSTQILHLRKVFDMYDTEKNGVITYSEFKQALKKMNYTEELLRQIFDSVVSTTRVFALLLALHHVMSYQIISYHLISSHITSLHRACRLYGH